MPKSKRTIARTDNVRSTHDLNFIDIIEDMIRVAYENELHNRKSPYKPERSARHKKSPVQNGSAAVACLLTFIVFESMVRRYYYSLPSAAKDKAHSEDLWWIINKIKPTVGGDEKAKSYYEELVLIRDIIVHAYIFEGTLDWSTGHKLIAINEQVVSGKKKEIVGRARRTKVLELHKSPNQIGFFDSAKFYLAFETLLETIGLKSPYDLWNWEGDEKEPLEWLEAASRKLRYSKAKIWSELKEKKDEEEFKDFMVGLAKIDS